MATMRFAAECPFAIGDIDPTLLRSPHKRIDIKLSVEYQQNHNNTNPHYHHHSYRRSIGTGQREVEAYSWGVAEEFVLGDEVLFEVLLHVRNEFSSLYLPVCEYMRDLAFRCEQTGLLYDSDPATETIVYHLLVIKVAGIHSKNDHRNGDDGRGHRWRLCFGMHPGSIYRTTRLHPRGGCVQSKMYEFETLDDLTVHKEAIPILTDDWYKVVQNREFAKWANPPVVVDFFADP